MEAADPKLLEARVRALVAAGDLNEAASVAIRRFGGEVFGFLLGTHHDDDEANDVFSAWSERVWRGLEGFLWDCSLRTWVYVLARNCSRDQVRSRRSRLGRAVLLSQSSAVWELVARVRTETLSIYRTQARSAVLELRRELPTEDQTLLILRLDRTLEWEELARVFLGDAEVSPDAVKRESARLRKRFQLVKERLLRMGRERGLLGKRAE